MYLRSIELEKDWEVSRLLVQMPTLESTIVGLKAGMRNSFQVYDMISRIQPLEISLLLSSACGNSESGKRNRNLSNTQIWNIGGLTDVSTTKFSWNWPFDSHILWTLLTALQHECVCMRHNLSELYWTFERYF